MASAKLEVIAQKREASGARRVPFLLTTKTVVHSADNDRDRGRDEDGYDGGR